MIDAHISFALDSVASLADKIHTSHLYEDLNQDCSQQPELTAMSGQEIFCTKILK